MMITPVRLSCTQLGSRRNRDGSPVDRDWIETQSGEQLPKGNQSWRPT